MRITPGLNRPQCSRRRISTVFECCLDYPLVVLQPLRRGLAGAVVGMVFFCHHHVLLSVFVCRFASRGWTFRFRMCGVVVLDLPPPYLHGLVQAAVTCVPPGVDARATPGLYHFKVMFYLVDAGRHVPPTHAAGDEV